jgi:hypothetical protein
LNVVLSIHYNHEMFEKDLDNIHQLQNEHIYYEVVQDFFDDENVNHFVNDYTCLINDPKIEFYI